MVSLEGVVISEALHWIEDGDHVLRSTEFDVVAGDADFDCALTKFLHAAEDLADFYVSLHPEITEDEARVVMTLLTRYTQAYRAGRKRLQRRSLRRLLARKRRRGNDHHSTFRPALTS